MTSFAPRFDMDAPAGAPAWMLLRYVAPPGGLDACRLAGISPRRYGSRRLAEGVARAALAAVAAFPVRCS